MATTVVRTDSERWLFWESLKGAYRQVVSSPGSSAPPSGMPRNVEIKVCSLCLLSFLGEEGAVCQARCSDAEATAAVAGELSDSLGLLLIQTDTFFHCPNARLKLRVTDNNPDGELIHYSRPNKKGPKASHFTRTPVPNAADMVKVLGSAYGVLGVVKKTRRLFLVGRVRIHVDEVQGLGSFVELEVVMEEGESEAVGVSEAEDLMRRLGIQESDLLETAYMDLLLDGSAGVPAVASLPSFALPS